MMSDSGLYQACRKHGDARALSSRHRVVVGQQRTLTRIPTAQFLVEPSLVNSQQCVVGGPSRDGRERRHTSQGQGTPKRPREKG